MENYYRLCLVIYNGKNHSIKGRTMLQKIIYFCQKVGWNVDYKFDYFGPVSSEVRNLLSSLIAADVISQQEGELPTFKLTTSGIKFFKEYEQHMNIDVSISGKIAELTNYLSMFERKELMRASIFDYIQSDHKNMKIQDLVKRVDDIYTDADEEQAMLAWKTLRKIRSKINKITKTPAIITC